MRSFVRSADEQKAKLMNGRGKWIIVGKSLEGGVGNQILFVGEEEKKKLTVILVGKLEQEAFNEIVL